MAIVTNNFELSFIVLDDNDTYSQNDFFFSESSNERVDTVGNLADSVYNTTIGIIVFPSKDNVIINANRRGKTSKYNIIVTIKNDLCLDLFEFQLPQLPIFKKPVCLHSSGSSHMVDIEIPITHTSFNCGEYAIQQTNSLPYHSFS
ncbi:hypothetical protein G9A89_005288 [Geosiphon pyriformis]|nr:hypothetical protein G9A89_005288 [Geosiphon pyriformis]